ncbi:unnamed protein product, partial [Urochloa humidicola]
ASAPHCSPPSSCSSVQGHQLAGLILPDCWPLLRLPLFLFHLLPPTKTRLSRDRSARRQNPSPPPHQIQIAAVRISLTLLASTSTLSQCASCPLRRGKKLPAVIAAGQFRALAVCDASRPVLQRPAAHHPDVVSTNLQLEAVTSDAVYTLVAEHWEHHDQEQLEAPAQGLEEQNASRAGPRPK